MEVDITTAVSESKQTQTLPRSGVSLQHTKPRPSSGTSELFLSAAVISLDCDGCCNCSFGAT